MADTLTTDIDLAPEILTAAADAKAWPFEEARKIVKRYERAGFPDEVLFETGYGRPACRISARSARWRARRWCGMRSGS